MRAETGGKRRRGFRRQGCTRRRAPPSPQTPLRFKLAGTSRPSLQRLRDAARDKRPQSEAARDDVRAPLVSSHPSLAAVAEATRPSRRPRMHLGPSLCSRPLTAPAPLFHPGTRGASGRGRLCSQAAPEPQPPAEPEPPLGASVGERGPLARGEDMAVRGAAPAGRAAGSRGPAGRAGGSRVRGGTKWRPPPPLRASAMMGPEGRAGRSAPLPAALFQKFLSREKSGVGVLSCPPTPLLHGGRLPCIAQRGGRRLLPPPAPQFPIETRRWRTEAPVQQSSDKGQHAPLHRSCNCPFSKSKAVSERRPGEGGRWVPRRKRARQKRDEGSPLARDLRGVGIKFKTDAREVESDCGTGGSQVQWCRWSRKGVGHAPGGQGRWRLGAHGEGARSPN